MDYETVKKLKDAGFPQNLDGNKQMNGKPMMFYSSEGDCYFPTLSELIAACGDKFSGLIINRGPLSNVDTKWSCAGDSRISLGATPEIAVANLWLALNKIK